MKQIFSSLVLLGLLALSAHAQKFEVTGTVVDGVDGLPVAYATVAVVSSNTGKIITGTTTLEDGKFSLRTDSSNVRLELSFIGYAKKIIENIQFNNGKAALGAIQLSQDSELLNEVEVTAEKSSVEFRLEKRVFNVGKDIASTGVGALEVLNNVPSVNVNIEGEVTLRGNSGVQILINGKPSVLADEQSNALGSISADMIESVEVITNPSAKYDAAGTSGILNIVLKKDEKKGFNGSASINTGYPHNHSIGASLNYRTEKFNFFTQFGGGYRTYPRISRSTNTNNITGTEVSSNGEGFKNENFYNISLGADYYINELNTLTLSGRFAYEIETNPSETQFSIYDSLGQLVTQYERLETTDATNPKWQYDLQYKKQFKDNEDHVLLFSTLGSFFGKDQSSEFLDIYSLGTNNGTSQRTATDFYQASYTFKLDYTHPLPKNFTIEAGSQFVLDDVGNEYSVYNSDDIDWVLDTNLTNDFNYNQKVLGVYTTGAYEDEKWGVKAGLRVEYTNLITELVTTNERNTQNYVDFFPSLHTSYKFSKRFSMQAGYSRRIFRPRLWDLNPFFNIQNNFNIRTGNPDLLPEYAHSTELTGILVLNKASLNGSVYYLHTSGVKENISEYDGEVNINKPVNLGTNDKVGVEVNGKYTPFKWWNLNADFNYGYFQRNGDYLNQSFDYEGHQWSAKATTKFKLPLDFEIEITGNYQSGFKTLQGSVTGYAMADAGIRKKILKGKAVINFGVRDIFASRIRETIVDQPDYSIYSFSQRGRFITLGFSYSFGKGEAMTYSGGKR